MTYMRPSNFKILDRCIRYIKEILRETHRMDVEYEEILNLLGEVSKDVKEEESLIVAACIFISNYYKGTREIKYVKKLSSVKY